MRLGGLGVLVRGAGAGACWAGPGGGRHRNPDRRRRGAATGPRAAYGPPVDRRYADDAGRAADGPALGSVASGRHSALGTRVICVTDALAVTGLVKTFGAKRAVDDLSLRVR